MTVHGEYKVPGGKLVVADLEVSEGVLHGVQISGDFFLEPDDALERIDKSLVGMPSSAGVRELSEVVASAAGPDAVMLGFDPKAVATAVRRALGHATGWHDHAFELIDSGRQDPQLQMALDEVIARQVGDGLRRPALRVWEWASNAVIIGSFQSLSNEVDLDAARRHEATVVRRISGGGAMFVEPGNSITYSLYVPGSLVDGMSFADSYPFLDDWVLRALTELGIGARYVSLNDISSPEGKIAGAAQKRLSNGAVLHHVTMSYDMDAQKMLDVLRIGREKISDKGVRSAVKRVDPLRSQTGLSRDAVVDSMVGHFRDSYGLDTRPLDSESYAEAERLVADKFGTEAWTTRVP